MCKKSYNYLLYSLLDIRENVLLDIRENVEWPRFFGPPCIDVIEPTLNVYCSRVAITSNSSQRFPVLKFKTDYSFAMQARRKERKGEFFRAPRRFGSLPSLKHTERGVSEFRWFLYDLKCIKYA